MTELDNLRLKAFASNSEEDKTAYYNRLSQAFQRGEMVQLPDLARKIAEASGNVDTDHPAIPRGDMQWRKGYKQACSDIIAMLHDTTTPS